VSPGCNRYRAILTWNTIYATICSMVESKEKALSAESIESQLYGFATEALRISPQGVHVVGGEPTEPGNHFRDHYFIAPGYDDQAMERIDGQVRILPLTDHTTFSSGYATLDSSGVAKWVSFRETGRSGMQQVEGKVLDSELTVILGELTDGRIVDPTKEVVVHRARRPDVNKGLPIRRVYKKGSLRLAGRSLIDRHTRP